MDLLTLCFGALFLLPASLHDLKTREVPDVLSYGFIFFGFAYGLAAAILSGDWMPLWMTLIGGGVMIAAGALLFYAGQWGGADSKLLIGVGALLGLGFGNWDAALFFILLLVAGAGYGMIYSVGLAFVHRKAFAVKFKENLRKYKKHRLFVVIGCLALVALVLVLSPAYKILLGTLAVMVYVTFSLWIIVKSVEESILIKVYPVGKLTEGDWINEEVKVDGKIVAGPGDLGVSKKQIALLMKSGVKKVIVKEGIPFVPSFLIALLLLPIVGEGLRVFLLAVF